MREKYQETNSNNCNQSFFHLFFTRKYSILRKKKIKPRMISCTSLAHFQNHLNRSFLSYFDCFFFFRVLTPLQLQYHGLCMFWENTQKFRNAF